MKKLLALLLAVAMLTGMLAACGEQKTENKGGSDTNTASGNPVDTLTAEKSTDKYRSYYQVWIGAFHDSNNDAIGDLPGLIEKLDYINDGDPNAGDDLGADGIWLSPMMPSSTYHKYNVEDYYNIDPSFGTLDDFDKLIKACHDRGVNVIIDLVVNHAGAGHEYFQKACEEIRKGKTDGYAKYFNFSKTQDAVYQHPVSGSDYYYQGDFWDQMPDWNLNYDGTRKYFEDVVKFWLDRGVDGFRLDAVKYFDDDNTDGTEFMKWFYDMAKGYKKDVYMVGEDWTDVTSDIYEMYETGIDSLFNFKFANNSGEYLKAGSAVGEFAKKLQKYDNNIKEHNKNAINANFLSNHDMNRLASMIYTDENKLDAALYMLSPGNSFTYYGEEIGIETEGSDDKYKRTAMVWDSDNLPGIKTEGVSAEDTAPLGGVKQQLADKNSLLNTYRTLFKLRLQNPEIARGDITELAAFNDSDCAGYVIDDDGSRVMIVHNVSDKEMELTIDLIKSPELRGWTVAQEKSEGIAPTLEGDSLKLPAKTSVVLKENK